MPTAASRNPSALRTILYGTGTNYLRVFVRLLGGLFTFRLLFKALGAQEFAFYQLLWSTVGYTILLDFGFGLSVQKAVASTLEVEDAESSRHRREAISTVFWSYVGLDLLLALVLLFFGDRMLHGLNFVGRDAIDHYRPVALIFALGVFAAFPFGIFREALRGLNKIHVNNAIDSSFSALQAIVIVTGCLLHWSLAALTTVSVVLLVIPNWVTALVAMRHPDLRPRLKDFRLSRLRGLSSFSVYAYLITMTGLIMSQCDQLVIGALVSVEAVALYVPGAKLGQVYWSLAAQMQDTLGPVAARMSGIKDQLERSALLKTLLVASQRWSLMISSLLALPLLIDMKGAIGLITGERAPRPETMQVGYLLVGTMALSIVWNLCTKRILMMINHHRILLGLSIVEAALNFGLSVYLTWRWQNCVGAAMGTFVASITVSCFAIPIYGCSVLKVSAAEFLWHGSARGLGANAGAFVVAALWWGLLFHSWNPTAHFLAGCGLCVVFALPGWWRIGMLPNERARLAAALKKFRNLPPAPASFTPDAVI